MHPSKLVLPLLLVALSFGTACTKPVSGSDDSTNGANFFVKSLKGIGNTGPINPSAVWKIPDNVEFSFTACLQDRSARTDLRGQDFYVINPVSHESFDVHTNLNGCFNWQEPIAYNHFAGQSGWITINRVIQARGVNTGSQTVTIGVNPWAVGEGRRDRDDEVKFLRAGDDAPPIKLFSAEAAAQAFSGELQGQSELLIQEVKIKAIPEGESGKWVALQVDMDMEPVVKSLNANGLPTYQKIQDGDFDLMMQVLGSNVGAEQNQKVLLLGGDMHAVGRAVNGKLQAEFKVRQERRANQGNLELVLQVRPRSLNAYKSLKSFNGLYRFGAGTVVKDDSGSVANMCLEDQANCTYDKLIQQASNFKLLMSQGYVQENSRYIFSNMKLRFVSILPGETATQRTVVYEVSTCITDNQTGQALASTPMVVRYLKNNKDDPSNREPDVIHKKTDESGCLAWNGQAFHKYYMPEEFFEKEVVIEKGEADAQRPGHQTHKVASFDRHLKFYLNPWDDKFTFGWDSREFTQDFFDQILHHPKVPSRFFLGDYSFHTVRFLYNIDQFMDLDVKKWVLMGLSPRVLRYSGIVNARKMVEPLRDGIYLMKVGIQKSYLDPHDNSSWLLHNTPQYQAEIEAVGPAQLPLRAKDFVTTNMALIRVVDGYIVYPIELTMRDLRLMRIRSNFLIQLETVDERTVQAYHVFRGAAIKDQKLDDKLKTFQDLEQKVKDFKETLSPNASIEDVTKKLGGTELIPDLLRAEATRKEVGTAANITAARQDLEARVRRVQEMIRLSIAKLKLRYDAGRNLGVMTDQAGQPTGTTVNVPNGSLINDNFEVNKDLFKELQTVMNLNDFSTVALPKRDEIDLNLFIENNSGLEKRSFVGPVIFLSNTYSDSMRATDNLDEAGCVDPKKGSDALRLSIDELDQVFDSDAEIAKVEYKLFNHRENNAYQFNKYFTSLNNLCYKNVDDLAEQETKEDERRLDVSKAASLKYNFVESFGLDFISLSDEPLTKVKPGCFGHVEDCLVETSEHTVKVGDVDKLVNEGLENAVFYYNLNPFKFVQMLASAMDFFRSAVGEAIHINKDHWDRGDYLRLFFSYNPDSKMALCNLLANKLKTEIAQTDFARGTGEERLGSMIFDACLRDGGLVHDLRYRVEQTGSYNFLGGLNLNFNVGESFSVGTSMGWSSGFEMTDVVGATSSLAGGLGGLKVASSLIKPFNMKYGTGMSASQGTGISESTYLVSQIAGFKVQLTAYERCIALRLTDEAVKSIATRWSDSRDTRPIGWQEIGRFVFRDDKVTDAFKHGLFVCEGQTRQYNRPVNVEENYFYFTQHFTEGDMLDQADLYNQPWLLALRGMRDFGTFVNRIRAQQIVNLPEFLYHVTGNDKPRMKGWALEHLFDVYKTEYSFKNMLPTFPGYYTVLDAGEEDINFFALNQVPPTSLKLDKVDRDPLMEVHHPTVVLPENRAKIVPPEAPRDDSTIYPGGP